MPRWSWLVLVGILCAGPATAQETVRLLANSSPPYSDPQLPEQGLAMELVSHVLERAGYRADITFDSWPRAMEGVSIGVYDALAAAWYTDARAKEYIYSKPYLDSRLILVKLRADNRDYTSIDDLAGKRLGVRVDYAYGVDFDAIPRLTLVRENHVIQNLLRLLNGSVDVVIGDQRTVALQLHEFLGDQIHKFDVVDISLPGRGRHLAATRAVAGKEKLVEAFNAALRETLKDGSHAEIIRKWDTRYHIPGRGE